MELEILDFDLRTAIEEMAELTSIQAQERQIEFNYHIQNEVPSLLKGDPGRLRQIIINLTSNAIKFTKKGEVVLEIHQESETDSHTKLKFSVKDTGIGISKEDLDRLFKSFHQVDASTTRKFGGTGLGLSISRQLVELMGGQIGVESTIGNGATFWFVIELEKQHLVKEKELILPLDIRGKRVLAVDDNQTNLTILKGYLENWGCDCDTALNGEVALSLMEAVAKVNAPFDLAIIDMQMPEMDGAELGRAIKANQKLHDTVLVMLSSRGMRGDAALMKKIGYAAYLTKPVRRSQLFDCLITVLSKAKKPSSDHGTELVTRHSIADARKQKFRILIAEDNIVNQKLVSRLLEKFGFSSDVVANGNEAVRALELVPYDMVLMDVQMPEMDGLEATVRIRNPNSKVIRHNIPIIAMTAHAMKGDKDRCLKAGMDNYISKPINPDTLLKAIEKYFLSASQNDKFDQYEGVV